MTDRASRLESLEHKFTRVDRSLLSELEFKVLTPLASRAPSCLHPQHLILSSLSLSLLNVLFGFLASGNLQWLCAVSVVIVAQIVTDHLDGLIGRLRHVGLVRWGYFMDHFLDYVFVCSMLAVYWLILDQRDRPYLFFVLALAAAFMTNAFLAFAATEEFRVSYFGIGPTEIRLAFAAINIGTAVGGLSVTRFGLACLTALASIVLPIVVYQTQKRIWRIDRKLMADREIGPKQDRDG